VPVEDLISGPAIIGLFQGSEKGTDPTFDFLFWMAVEPIVAADPTRALGAYLEDGARSTWPFSAEILRKVMRRTCDLRNEAILSDVVMAFGRIPSGATQAIVAGLRGLLEGQRGKAIVPNAEAVAVVSRLATSSDPEVSRPAQQLGTLWGDATALKQVLARIQNAAAPESDRIAAIQTAAQQKGDDALRAVVGLVVPGNSDRLQVAAVRALQQLGGEDSGRQLLDRWSTLSPAVRAAVADLATARWQWRHALLQALLDGRIKRGEVPPTVVRKLAANPDDGEKAVVARIFGKIQSTPEEKLQIIAQKRKVVVEGPVDLEKGRVVAQRNCFVCHKLHGEGAAVGPELTGVGRSSLDALLHNVIHPNAIIGEGYENTEVVTRDERTFNGRMVENTDTVVKLLMAGPTEVVLAKSDIKTVRNTGVSTMPESLEQIPDDEFRNLIWYILAPPQDGKPLTEERRRELIGL
jgi:putative heme-binding domain-containing protein